MSGGEGHARAVSIAAGAKLGGELALPTNARGLVVLATAGDGGTAAENCREVAAQLRSRIDVGTLVFDLLTPEERERGGADVSLLAQRLSAGTDWALADDETRHLPIAYFATGSGAAAALAAASSRSDVRGVVSSSGRPDLAGAALEAVRVPTLLIVTEEDDALLALNRSARSRLRASELAVVVGCGHALDDPGAREEVARRAGAFYERHLR